MDSFLSWIGGKKALREVIVKRFPLYYDRYIEVFGGGGWVLFHKPPDVFEVYNDYNSNLTNLFYIVKYQPAAFLCELGWLPLNGREEFELLKRWLDKADFLLPHADSEKALIDRYMTDLEIAEYKELMIEQTKLGDIRRAVLFFKLIRYSYASGCTSFSCQPTNILRTYKTIWQANRRLNDNGFKNENDRERKSTTVGKGVIVENKDFEALIHQYDRDNAFFYCDPPYFLTEKHYAVEFPKENHHRLRDTLMNIQGKFMLSYNDCEFVRSLYDGCYIEPFERLNSISQRYDPGNMFKEVIVTNYNMAERLKAMPKQIALLDM